MYYSKKNWLKMLGKLILGLFLEQKPLLFVLRTELKYFTEKTDRFLMIILLLRTLKV